ncbi:MAG: hypothetical protein K2Z81_28010, partial [Cyanobacteria bacterium]|nr:hypothetical protein [Cyanobacteriota bacterium]
MVGLRLQILACLAVLFCVPIPSGAEVPNSQTAQKQPAATESRKLAQQSEGDGGSEPGKEAPQQGNAATEKGKEAKKAYSKEAIDHYN